MKRNRIPAASAHFQTAPRVRVVRGVRVLMDSDLAAIYGVSADRLVVQVERNLDRFPEDFAFALTAQELAGFDSDGATTAPARRDRRHAPWVFTELGILMLSSILRSDAAARINIELIRALFGTERPGEPGA